MTTCMLISCNINRFYFNASLINYIQSTNVSTVMSSFFVGGIFLYGMRVRRARPLLAGGAGPNPGTIISSAQAQAITNRPDYKRI